MQIHELLPLGNTIILSTYIDAYATQCYLMVMSVDVGVIP
jgi:hypothetical protein